MRRIRPATVLLVALIAVLAGLLVRGQRREVRLRAAMADYKERAGGTLRNLLELPTPLDWPDGTPLREAIVVIATNPLANRAFARGLPLVVDPDGLREAGRTLDSPLEAPPKDPATGDPPSLRRQLEILLEPLGLAAEVRDGAIVITSRGRAGEPAAVADQEGEP